MRWMHVQGSAGCLHCRCGGCLCPAPTSPSRPQVHAPSRCRRLEKGVIADRVLHSGHGEASFAQRLGALLRCA